MSFPDTLLAMFLCITREDGTGDRHKRAVLFLEMISLFVLGSVAMVVFGILNLRITNYFIWALTSIVIGLINYFFLDRYYIKSNRYKKIIELSGHFKRQKKIVYAVIAIFVILFSACLLIMGGIIMSYLLKQNLYWQG